MLTSNSFRIKCSLYVCHRILHTTIFRLLRGKEIGIFRCNKCRLLRCQVEMRILWIWLKCWHRDLDRWVDPAGYPEKTSFLAAAPCGWLTDAVRSLNTPLTLSVGMCFLSISVCRELKCLPPMDLNGINKPAAFDFCPPRRESTVRKADTGNASQNPDKLLHDPSFPSPNDYTMNLTCPLGWFW